MAQSDISTAYFDLSNYRQLGNHEELFAGGDNLDLLIHVEILELATKAPSDPVEAAKWHWNQIAQENEAKEPLIISAQPSTHKLCEASATVLVEGRQVCKKRDESDEKLIQVNMCLFRLFDRKYDILVTFSSPFDSEGDRTQEWRQACESFKINDWGLFAH